MSPGANSKIIYFSKKTLSYKEVTLTSTVSVLDLIPSTLLQKLSLNLLGTVEFDLSTAFLKTSPIEK